MTQTQAEAPERAEAVDPYSSPMCVECRQMYDKLYADGKTKRPFPPRCRGDLRLLEGNYKAQVDPIKKARAVIANPTAWCEYELNTQPRWYQDDMLCCTARQKVMRAGRRIGKTWSLVIRAMHRMVNRHHYRVIVVAPYQHQIDLIFDIFDELISRSRSISNNIKRRVRSPQLVELGNGSSMKGFPSGVKSGGKSDKVRGQDADEIIIDEIDYLPEEDIDAIVAILASNKETLITVSSTPTGRKTKYWGFCTYKDQMWKEFKYTSMVSPEWTEETEEILRGMYSDAAWQHEIMAEFGDFEEGVFPTGKLESSLANYSYANCRRDSRCTYALGIDWNGYPIGIHMVVVEYDPLTAKFRTVAKKISNDKEFTQHSGIQDIISMYKTWMPKWVWADAGAGNMQIESLKKVAKEHPDLKMSKKVRGLHMHGNEIVKDPITKQDVKKQIKALMVDLCVRRVEIGSCEFPMPENDEDQLVDQLRNYKIDRITPTGTPVFSQGVDHTAIAWMCAMYAILINCTDIKKVQYCNKVIAVGSPGPARQLAPDVQKQSAIDKILGSRDLGNSEDAKVASFKTIERNPSPDRPRRSVVAVKRAKYKQGVQRTLRGISNRSTW